MRSRFKSPLLWIGLAGIVLAEGLLFADVLGVWHSPATRLTRANMTPLCWLFYLLATLGLLSGLDGASWLRRYRWRFGTCALVSVPIWCWFDWINFYFMRDPATGLGAWEYIDIPPRFSDRVLGYLIAFGAIAPGMFLTAELLQRLGLARLNAGPAVSAIKNQKSKIKNRIALAVFILGLALAPIPILIGTPASNLALWVGTWALLDPVNRYFGRPSILGDWFAGRWGRTLSLGGGGLICGFLWEFWNFWAFTKWKYHLPFLGAWENFRYFEMPVLGLIGFIAFGLETWAMWQTSLLLLAPFVEGEGDSPADRGLHDYGCL